MSLHAVVTWVRSEGDLNALNRLRLRVLASTIKEGISLDQVSPATNCSDECLARVREAASAIVGQPCPH